ncbi:MAG TPA: DUF3306 domain-containing protein [Magnetospirillum sp.]|nr:DUF3306 domain-containing protein [Magnetospirillum sp.]
MSEGFLGRWSRLKGESKTEAEAPAAHAAEPAAEAPSPAPEPPPDLSPPDLPPVESLTKDSDFSAFLQAGVPDDIRRAALSKLWTSDPLFSQPEVFDLHMEDYNAHPLGEAVRTAWKVGKGIADQLADAPLPATFTDGAENSHTNTEIDEGDTRPS